MEKLIELVVKCQKELKQGYSLWDTEGAIKNSKEILISKSFGFIERLIKNNKIDTFKILEKRFDTQKGCERVHYHTVNEGNTYLLLMLLAISDNSIEDLISYLR